MNQTLVSTKYQVVIPKEVRKKIQVKPGQRLNIDTKGNQIILSPAQGKQAWIWPDDYIKNLRGLWKNTKDVEKYLEEERNSWD
jgi:AbrB family looped-hinge helix DNA binding protein